MYLVLDTETTGLPIDYNAPVQDIRNWPRVVQLAYQIYDENEILTKEVNHIIKPGNFEIPSSSSNIHGITMEMAISKGISIEEALAELTGYVNEASVIIGHNISFDCNVIDCELVRLRKLPILSTVPHFCTMKSTTNICKIEGRYGYKWPSLRELYFFLFKEPFGPEQGQHNAIADVKATARIYFHIVHTYDL